jgi:hypothetical protein
MESMMIVARSQELLSQIRPEKLRLWKNASEVKIDEASHQYNIAKSEFEPGSQYEFVL